MLNFPASGRFGLYYEIFDTQYPVGFLHDLFHFGATRIGTSLLWMRISVLPVGLATWALLRSYLAGTNRDPRTGRDLCSRLTLASTFLLFWFAWLSTLRPEPAVALLSVVAIIGTQRFVNSATLGSLAVAAIAAAVAVTIHPTGVIAGAPLLAATPMIWAWVRAHGLAGLMALMALGLTAAAVFVLLLMADTDLTRWRESRSLVATDPWHQYTWRDEPERYRWLFMDGFYGPVVRRASVLLPLTAVGLFLTRSHRRRQASFDLPIVSLVLGAALMALTPSKWPWQFGALGGFAALAVATEIGRLVREPAGSRSRNLRSVLVVAGVVTTSVIAWRGGADFGPFTVLEVDFGRGGAGLLGVDLSSPLPWLLLGAGTLGAIVIVAALWGRPVGRPALDRWLANMGAWAPTFAAGVVLAATLSLFVVDAVKHTPAWSLPRQHYKDLAGQTCGLADDIGVADPTAGEPLAIDAVIPEAAAPAAPLPAATRSDALDFTGAGAPADPFGVELHATWGSKTTTDHETGVFLSPWFVVAPSAGSETPDQRGVALFTSGRPNSGGNQLVVQFGRRDGQTIHALGTAPVAASDSDVAWSASSVDPPAGADRVRVVAVDASSQLGGWLAFSVPRQVQYEPLADELSRPDLITLVSASLRFYFPCVTNPTITAGVVQPPDYYVGVALSEQSPMAGVPDVYPRQRLLVRTSDGTTVPGLDVDRIAKRRVPGIDVPLKG